MISMNLKRLTDTAIIPTYATPDAAGADLHADILTTFKIEAGARALIPTNIAVELPRGFAILICPRSGLSNKSGITVHNGPGVIDADYRGGIGVILHNTTHARFEVNPGDRIAQMVIVPVFQAVFDIVEDLGETKRGAKGFGSTGMSKSIELGLRVMGQDAADRRRFITDCVAPGREALRVTTMGDVAPMPFERRFHTGDIVGGERVARPFMDLPGETILRPAPGQSESQTKDNGAPEELAA